MGVTNYLLTGMILQVVVSLKLTAKVRPFCLPFWGNFGLRSWAKKLGCKFQGPCIHPKLIWQWKILNQLKMYLLIKIGWWSSFPHSFLGGCFFIRAFTVFVRQKSDLLRLVEKKTRHQLWSHIARPLLHLGMKHGDFYGKTGYPLKRRAILLERSWTKNYVFSFGKSWTNVYYIPAPSTGCQFKP